MQSQFSVLGLLFFFAVSPVVAADVDPRELFRDEAGEGEKTVWQWTDEAGTVHVSEHPGEIPQAMWPRVRKRVMRVQSEPPARGEAVHGEDRGASIVAPYLPRKQSAVPNVAEWAARQDAIIADYQAALKAVDDAGFAISRAASTGAPPAALAAAREERAAAISRAKALWRELGDLPGEFAKAGGNPAWLPPQPADLPKPPGFEE